MRKSILIEITNKCNLRCKHCYNSSYLNDIDINETNLFENVKILKENGFNHIHFLGGEPLMNSKLVRYILEFKKMGFSLTINTNATLIDEYFIENTLPLIDQISFSLDGATAEINDAIRNKGTYDNVIYNISKIKNTNVKLLLNYVITNTNYYNLYKIIDIADKLSVDYINLLWFYEVESNNTFAPMESEFNLIFDELENLLVYSENYKNVNINFDLAPKVLEYLKKIGLIKDFYNKNKCKCFAENVNIYMNVLGEVYPCHPFHEQYHFAYNLLNGSYSQYSNQVKDIIKNNSFGNDMCNGCIYIDKCLECPIERNNKFLCEFIEKRYSGIITRFYEENNEFIINQNFQIMFQNKIIDRRNNKIFNLTKETVDFLLDKKNSKYLRKNNILELYGLICRGVISERLS